MGVPAGSSCRTGAAAASLTADELDSALAGHPRIGEKASSPEHQTAFSEREQAGVDPADAAVAARLGALRDTAAGDRSLAGEDLLPVQLRVHLADPVDAVVLLVDPRDHGL